MHRAPCQKFLAMALVTKDLFSQRISSSHNRVHNPTEFLFRIIIFIISYAKHIGVSNLVVGACLKVKLINLDWCLFVAVHSWIEL